MTSQPQIPDLKPRRILVRGVNWLGDAILTTPALLRLRERFAGARITLLTPQKLAGLWAHFPALDQVLAIAPGEGVFAVAKKLRSEAARATPFELALVLPNSPRSALEVFLAGIPQRVGHARTGRNFFLTHAIRPRPGAVRMRKLSAAQIRKIVAENSGCKNPNSGISQSAHQIHEYLHLAGALGANPEPLAPQLAVLPDEIAAAKKKFGLENLSQPLLGLNPGAEYGPAKRWPVERFIAAAGAIQSRTNCAWLIFGGKADAAIAAEIEAAHAGRSAFRNLAGQTSLRELMALLKSCRVLLTNDTGPMHVAAALGTPVVALFGSTSVELTGPVFSGLQHQWIRSDAPCSPCFLRECPIDFRCMNGIAVEPVIQAVLRAL